MLRAVTGLLGRLGTEAWLVGGSVRDRHLGRYAPDLDIAVAGDPAAVAAELATALKAHWFALSERHPTYRVLGSEGYVDVAAIRAGSIEADLGLRDFTVNAMAVPLAGGDLVDPFGGRGHVEERLLVGVSEQIFADDPLRLMRAARFCHVLGFRLAPELTKAVRSQAGSLPGAAAERITAEMNLTLGAGGAAEVVRLWQDLGLLAVVMPEVSTEERFEPLLEVLERLDDLLDRPGTWFPEAADLLERRLLEDVDGATSRPVALRLAGLLHSLAGNEAVGVAKRLRLSGEMASLLGTIGRLCGTGGAATAAVELGLPAAPRRADVLVLWEAAPWEPETIVVAAAVAGERGDARGLMGLLVSRLRGAVRPLPLDGDTLMEELGLSAGPLVGRALHAARLAWETGEATTRAEVLAAARAALEDG
jgi:poly(A) polymerase